MNNISMSRISPKLISVENNRVGDEGGTYKIYTDEPHNYSDREEEGVGTYGGGKGLSKLKYTTEFREGRFPTQLFTNIKNDKFKYVKNIT